ncbi:MULTISPECIES: transporter [Pantoea]|jgi:zinc transporter|uniref:transporter n=1 Tax=Pantoea TaxID=53335 RepID=UPI0007374C6C|nr:MULTISPECIES: transporter [Pantoea]KTS16831.1 magnesium transporter CorA [Pantoea dispersa]KTS32993.1 magnesium transporter CorA [Pantoea dispersa]KTS58115.1 magnesium transporter CorA [Pantoea dispersa]KTS89747.1 magnesium transporter CorA [Pantoea dispersa]MBU6516758.1 transporter [Pantoea sp. B270]
MLQPVLPLASLPDFNNEVAGLIHGYLFNPDAPPQRLNAREAAQLARHTLPDGCFLWLHINLNHARAERWVQDHFSVDDDFFDEIHSASPRTRLAQQNDALLAVLNDVTFSKEERNTQNATLWIWCRPQVMVSARYRPVGMIERMHQQIDRLCFSAPDAMLLWLLGEQEAQLEQVVRRSSQAVDAIEERLLSAAIKANRSELGHLRRMLLRVQRLLAPEPAALFRLLNRPPNWLNREPLSELRIFTEEFSVALNDLASLMERIRLLQEEIAARLMEQSNRTLFLLTSITVLALPINIVAGFFGMNVGGIPLANNPHGFLLLVLVVLVFTLVAGWLALRRPHD